MKAILGDFVFSMDSAVWHEIKKGASQRLVSKSRFGMKPAIHDAGSESDTLNLPFRIVPQVMGNVASIDALKDLMRSGESQQLIGLDGRLKGRWYIHSVNETHQSFGRKGHAQVIDFEMALIEDAG